MLEINKIHQGDCLELMKEIPDKSVDMVLCDLPYGTTKNKWDTVIDLNLLWEQYERIIKDRGVIVLTAQTPFDKILGSSNIKLLKYEWIWIKEQGTGFLNVKKMPLKSSENILIFYKKQPVYNPQIIGNEKRVIKRISKPQSTTNYNFSMQPEKSIYYGRYPNNVLKFKRDKGLHPTQKPVKLFEYLIKTYTDEDMLVLDNCIGSGTTAVACLNTNRNFIGIELEEEYCKIARERINKQSPNT